MITKIKKLLEKKSRIALIGFTALSFLLTNGFVFSKANSADRNNLVIQSWGGALTDAMKKAFFEPFSKETGIEVTVVEGGVDVGGKLAAMVRINNIEWDVTGDYLAGLKVLYDKGLLEDIDYSIVTNTKDLVPGAIKKWSVGYILIATCMVYNTDEFSSENHPTGLLDFFDVDKYPGQRSIANWGEPFDNMAIALLYDGVPKDQLFPLDFDRAFKVLDKVKPHVRVWFTSGDQLMQALLDEEVIIAASPDGRYQAAKKLGAKIQNVWKDGYYFISGQAVVKGSPMKEAAMRYLDFCNRPEQQAILAEAMGYAGTNKKAVNFINPSIQKELPTHPDNISQIFNMMEVKNANWALDNMNQIEEKWNNWIAR